jgi:hypothetical protein
MTWLVTVRSSAFTAMGDVDEKADKLGRGRTWRPAAGTPSGLRCVLVCFTTDQLTVRGGSWGRNLSKLRCSYRGYETSSGRYTFRCARGRQ